MISIAAAPSSLYILFAVFVSIPNWVICLIALYCPYLIDISCEIFSLFLILSTFFKASGFLTIISIAFSPSVSIIFFAVFLPIFLIDVRKSIASFFVSGKSFS